MVGDKLNFNWQEVFNKFSDDLANAFDLFTGNLKLTKVFKATIIEKINDTVYKISYKNAEYKVKSYYDLIIGDIVWVCAPGGDWDSLFVQSYNGFLDRIVTTDKVVNNLTTNVAGTVLDGRMGKSLNDKITTLNSNLGYEYDYVSGTLSTPTDYLISICNIWLPTGTYIVNSGIRLTLTTTSRVDRYLKIGDSQDSRGSGSLVLAAGYQVFTHSCVIKISESSKNVVLQGRHFNGTTLSVDGWLNVTRLK